MAVGQGHDAPLLPLCLREGDRVRLVSPASTPSEDGVHACARIFESWGLRVELGRHVFKRVGFLAGTDEERLEDFNTALQDEGVRAIFATRGGKGSYRIANKLDFTAAARDPKFVIGFSDITALHLSLYRACRLAGIHGPLSSWSSEVIGPQSNESLRRVLTTTEPVVIRSDPGETTAALTTREQASGPLIGGNLDTLATCAGWALPSLGGAILLIEAVRMGRGQLDRQLTMLANAGHLQGLAGVAVGQFSKFAEFTDGWTEIEVLRDHLSRYDVPVLGGLPLGHGTNPLTVPIGTLATLDADAGELRVAAAARSAD